jgi:two-component system, OmpR family, sensor kinase
MMPPGVTSDRLTRQELSWLLAQEARGAAKALRDGVSHLKQPVVEISELPEVTTNLDALDEAIDRLTELQTGSHGKARRGRIDLAALLCEVAPNARIAMEPGAGTEVFGEEGELRRMLHVLVSQTNADPTALADASPTINIRRQDEWVRVSVELGPDSSATAELERRWLSRMAVRHGGRLELEGGTESILLPADGASDQREVVELRKELEQAQQLGEAYARELATMLAAGELPSERPPPLGPVDDRLEVLIGAASALCRSLRSLLEGMKGDVAPIAEQLGDQHTLAQSVSRRVVAGFELLAELERIAHYPRQEAARRHDLGELVREAVAVSDARASRHGVELAADAPSPLGATYPRGALIVLVRSLIDHAIAASPRGARVLVRAVASNRGCSLIVEDGGPAVPAAQRSDLIRRRVDPTALGRPNDLSLLVADAIAGALGTELVLGESAAGRSQVEVRL